DIGIIDPETGWDWRDEKRKFPKDEVPYTAQLIITTQGGAECKSPPITIPVMQAKTEKRTVALDKDSTNENYSMILFPFDKSEAGPINNRIMKDYVYDRCLPTSYIEVIGHTDVVGLYDHNKALSERRSNTVHQGIMTTTKGAVGKILKRGVGEDEPMYNNELPEGRFYNRTVQVKIKTPLSAFQK
ncbi:MAG: OmpA family protein, partial [Bacteroidota bacterium]